MAVPTLLVLQLAVVLVVAAPLLSARHQVGGWVAQLSSGPRCRSGWWLPWWWRLGVAVLSGWTPGWTSWGCLLGCLLSLVQVLAAPEPPRLLSLVEVLQAEVVVDDVLEVAVAVVLVVVNVAVVVVAVAVPVRWEEQVAAVFVVMASVSCALRGLCEHSGQKANYRNIVPKWLRSVAGDGVGVVWGGVGAGQPPLETHPRIVVTW